MQRRFSSVARVVTSCSYSSPHWPHRMQLSLLEEREDILRVFKARTSTSWPTSSSLFLIWADLSLAFWSFDLLNLRWHDLCQEAWFLTNTSTTLSEQVAQQDQLAGHPIHETLRRFEESNNEQMNLSPIHMIWEGIAALLQYFFYI